MNKEGFSLIDVIIGLFLLGLMSVTILPIISSSFINLSRNNIKMEMNYIGEMAIERIKAFNEGSPSNMHIYDVDMIEIIDLFRTNDTIQITLPREDSGEKYLLKINKDQQSDNLWKITVYVYHNKEGSNINNVEYKAYLLAK